jgi:hypothetical protein
MELGKGVSEPGDVADTGPELHHIFDDEAGELCFR